MSIRAAKRKPASKRSFDFRISFLTFLLLTGCGAPGEPVPPSPAVPVAITDLAARQSGDAVQLTFTLPNKSVSGDRLAEPPTVEILRGAPRSDGSPDPKSFRVVDTIPGSLVENYVTQGRLQFLDPIAPEETRAHPGETIIYRVRTRVSQKRAAADSNGVTLRIFPIPERISSLDVHVTETAIELNWPVPVRTSGGDPLNALSTYHLYRGELDPASFEAASKDLAQAKWIATLAQIAAPGSNSYRDTNFDFGKTYLYAVRSVISAGGETIESADSVPAIITPRDTFPPAAPQNVVAAVLPGAAGGSSQVDLSWSINVENDLAGYRVYRSEQQGTRGQLLTSDVLPVPAYLDPSVVSGHTYWYTVTAMDRAGNESALSASVVVEVAQPSL